MEAEHQGQATNWNVVIAGHWNPAILTPDGISTRLFKLEPGTPVNVEVSLDVDSYPRVRHDDIVVQVSRSNLVLAPAAPSLESLAKAVDLANNALTGLSETPLIAAGVNFRFSYPQAPNWLIDAVDSSSDALLSDQGFNVKNKLSKRVIAWKNGSVNIELSLDNETTSGVAVFNYHLNSASAQEHIAWTERYEDMHASVLSILKTLSGE